MSDIEYEKQPYSFGEYDQETNMSIDTEYDRHINDAFKEAQAKSEKAGEGISKDKMITVPVAFGRDYYVITKVNKKSVHIEWRGFCADNWHDRTLGWGGSFPTHCIESHVRFTDGLKRIFS